MKRKHSYYPCGLEADPKFLDWLKEDWDTDNSNWGHYRKLNLRTHWCAHVTEAQWRDLLAFPDGGKRTANISKLIRKVAEWLAAYWHIDDISPDLATEILEKANTMRRDMHVLNTYGLQGVFMRPDQVEDAFKNLLESEK